MQQFDLAIIGGGLVGASFARAIADSGLKTVIIDQQPANILYSSSLDNRGLALSYSSVQILTDLKVWPLIEAQAHPIKTVHVSEQHSFGFTKLRASTFELPSLGYVVSASAIGAALICGLEDLPQITVMRPVVISDVCYDNVAANWTVQLENLNIKAKLLIAADGSNSFLRAKQNIGALVRDPKQSAIVTNLIVQQAVIDTAYERFTQQGVLAILPFGRNQVKCVWTIDNSCIDNFKSLSDQEFVAAVQAAFGFRLGRFTAVSERKIFPIQIVQADRLYDNGIVLLGNAANSLHPVAAQGFNLGLRDVAVLAKILKSGSYDLQSYAIQRANDHQITQDYTNTLVELFASDIEILKFSRRIGLLATQFIPSLNRKISARGMGI